MEIPFEKEKLILSANGTVSGPSAERVGVVNVVTQETNYPQKYVKSRLMKDGSGVVIRPIRPEDEEMMIHFHEALSDHTVYLRYFHPLKLSKRVSHERLLHICTIDYEMEMVLVAERNREIIGVARLNRLRDDKFAEVAVVVRDECQRLGLGTAMIRSLIKIAGDKNVNRISADILPDNKSMQKVFLKLGFLVRFDLEEGVMKAELGLEKS